MKHINFMVNRPRIQIGRGKFELNYWVMIFISIGVLAVGLTTHLILSRQVSSYQQQLALMSQVNPTVETPVIPIVGVAWSDWLKKYSAEFPRYLRLNKINGTTKDTKKLVLEISSQTALDASRAKKYLVKTGLCKEVELKNSTLVEESVTFELECTIS